MKHISSLDGLRGSAVLLVVTYHYMPRARTGVFGLIASTGWAGVDVFLVLSGFLITTILFEQREHPHFFRNFYMRRTLRLFPLYYAILLGICLLTPFLHLQWHWPQIGLFLYCANYVLGYSDFYAQIGPFCVRHFWTLALEEQFYLFWPWIVGAAVLSRRRLLQICAFGIVLAPVLRFVALLTHVRTSLILYALPTRFDSLFLGAALALMPLPSLKIARIAFFVSLLPILYFGIYTKSLNVFNWGWGIGLGLTFVAIAAAAVLVLSIYPTTLFHRVTNQSWLRFFGRYSYGIYLWHFLFRRWFEGLIAGVTTRIVRPVPSALISLALILGISTLLALASYHWLEAPFLRLKRRFEH